MQWAVVLWYNGGCNFLTFKQNISNSSTWVEPNVAGPSQVWVPMRFHWFIYFLICSIYSTPAFPSQSGCTDLELTQDKLDSWQQTQHEKSGFWQIFAKPQEHSVIRSREWLEPLTFLHLLQFSSSWPLLHIFTSPTITCFWIDFPIISDFNTPIVHH